MLIDRPFIEEAITTLTNSKLYNNEAQLQFELACEIKKALITAEITNWRVELEYPSATTTKVTGKIQNILTDIMLISDEGEYIPIELKYKTKSITIGGKTLLKTHGAQDLGRFDFLWDVKRIENLKSKKWTLNGELKKFLYGFSIMVTNDSLYWTTTKGSLAPKTPAYYDFCIGDKEKIIKGMALNWRHKPKSKSASKWRSMVCPFVFDNAYTCEWDKLSGCSVGFERLILEIK